MIMNLLVLACQEVPFFQCDFTHGKSVDNLLDRLGFTTRELFHIRKDAKILLTNPKRGDRAEICEEIFGKMGESHESFVLQYFFRRSGIPSTITSSVTVQEARSAGSQRKGLCALTSEEAIGTEFGTNFAKILQYWIADSNPDAKIVVLSPSVWLSVNVASRAQGRSVVPPEDLKRETNVENFLKVLPLSSIVFS